MLYQVNGEYHFTPPYHFFVGKVLKSTPSTYQQQLLADDKIIEAIEKGKFSFLKQDQPTRFHAPNVISDDLGIKGVQNPGNGQMYDSKSELRKAYKRDGLIEMGSDATVKERTELRGNYDVSKELSQAIDQTGFMDKIKRKK